MPPPPCPFFRNPSLTSQRLIPLQACSIDSLSIPDRNAVNGSEFLSAICIRVLGAKQNDAQAEKCEEKKRPTRREKRGKQKEFSSCSLIGVEGDVGESEDDDVQSTSSAEFLLFAESAPATACWLAHFHAASGKVSQLSGAGAKEQADGKQKERDDIVSVDPRPVCPAATTGLGASSRLMQPSMGDLFNEEDAHNKENTLHSFITPAQQHQSPHRLRARLPPSPLGKSNYTPPGMDAMQHLCNAVSTPSRRQPPRPCSLAQASVSPSCLNPSLLPMNNLDPNPMFCQQSSCQPPFNDQLNIQCTKEPNILHSSPSQSIPSRHGADRTAIDKLKNTASDESSCPTISHRCASSPVIIACPLSPTRCIASPLGSARHPKVNTPEVKSQSMRCHSCKH